MSDMDRLLAQVEELKRLAARPDDSWMERMSTEELKALGKRVRKVADGLTGLQGQLARNNPGARPVSPSGPTAAQRGSAGSLGSMVRRDTATGAGTQWTPPAAQPTRPAVNPFPMAQTGGDLANPGRRRVGGGGAPRESGPAAPAAPQQPNTGRFAPWQRPPADGDPPRTRRRPTY
ncbi:MAG TPA: hypothetical protein VFW71_05210 [Actinomycetota bacterium]|nr:hypothetical protein [Actinomycetota bacterium]